LDTLISNVTVVTMNPRMEVLFGAYIAIDGGKIVSIGKTAPEEAPKTIIDGTGMVAMPGLVNCHTHLAATAMRGLFDELPEKEALEQLLQCEAKMDSRCAKAAATLGIAECLRFGITSVSDLYYFPEATAQAIADAGMKANIALSAYRFIDENEDFDFDTDEQCGEFARVYEKWHGYDDGRIRIDAGIYAEYTGNHKLWEGLVAFAQEHSLGMQLHLSQTEAETGSCLDRTGLSPAQLLDCHSIFSVPATAAGCGYLSEEDQLLLGKRKASCVALPLADAKAGQKSAAIADCVKAGMNVALGTDGAAQWGSMDLFEVMRAAVFSNKAGQNKTPLPLSAALMMATVCGARAQNRADQCGMLEAGMDADIVLVDFSAPHLIPCHNVVNALVSAAKGGDVAMTMVRGNILYQNGQFPTIDLKHAVEELMQYTIPKLLEPPKE